MSQNGFYLLTESEQTTFLSNDKIHQQFNLKFFDREEYIKYIFDWIDSQNNQRSMECWKLKSYGNLYVIFSTSRTEVEEFLHYLHQLIHQKLSVYYVDLQLMTEYMKYKTDTAYSNVSDYHNLPSPLITKKDYQININDKVQQVELSIDGLISFNFEAEHKTIIQMVEELIIQRVFS